MPGMGRVVEALLAMSMPSWRDGGYRRSLSAKLGMGEGNCCRSLQRVDALDRTGSGKTPPGCGLHNAPSPRAALCSRLYRPGEWKNPTPDL